MAGIPVCKLLLVVLVQVMLPGAHVCVVPGARRGVHVYIKPVLFFPAVVAVLLVDGSPLVEPLLYGKQIELPCL